MEYQKSSNIKRKNNKTSNHYQAPVITWSGFDTHSILESSNQARKVSVQHSIRWTHATTQRRQEQEQSEQDGEELDNSKDKALYLSKDDFSTMHILGQFNLGFILAMDQIGHLWILDQHACDEKYNFEKLWKETKIHEQKLIAPLPLELSPSEEDCVMEHMELFEKNGFRFHHDTTKPPRHRLSLLAVPHSGTGGDGRKSVQFGPQDVGALCAILGSDGACSSNGYIAGSGTGSSGTGKSGNNAVRRHAGGIGKKTIMLPKTVAMLASRACRSSIMVGQSLSQRKMEEIVLNLRDVEDPWTCAHGRPTVRHVKDLLDILQDDK
jgi:DNA mismatch repair protein PMS2